MVSLSPLLFSPRPRFGNVSIPSFPVGDNFSNRYRRLATGLDSFINQWRSMADLEEGVDLIATCAQDRLQEVGKTHPNFTSGHMASEFSELLMYVTQSLTFKFIAMGKTQVRSGEGQPWMRVFPEEVDALYNKIADILESLILPLNTAQFNFGQTIEVCRITKLLNILPANVPRFESLRDHFFPGVINNDDYDGAFLRQCPELIKLENRYKIPPRFC